MNTLQEQILYTLYAIHISQSSDSAYYTEGTSSDNFQQIGNDITIENEIPFLEGLGYVQSFNLKTGKKGLFLTQLGLNWMVSDMATKKAAIDAINQAQIVPNNRVQAIATKDDTSQEGMRLRALILILLDELNVIRTWTRDFKIEVSQASSLANLKTRVATLPDLTNRTLAQAKTAYESHINNGNAD